MFTRIAVRLSAILFALAATAHASVLFSDNFNGGMSSAWSIVRPDSTYYTFQPSYLDLRANSGDLWLSINNAKNVFLVQNPTVGDFDRHLGIEFLHAHFDLLRASDCAARLR